jgi:acetyl-CoA C-acetyltransferase
MSNLNPRNTAKPVYIIDGRRSPFLKMKGKSGPFSAADLAVACGKSLISTMPFMASDLDQVIVGCVMPSEEEANIGRIISLRMGCGVKVPGWTVQRNCASGIQALDAAYQSIALGEANLVMAGGTEAMSRAPLLYSKAMVEWFARLQMAKTMGKKVQAFSRFRPNLLAPVIALLKGLTDPVVNLNMGQTAEELAYQFKLSRSQMDEFSVQSHLKAEKARIQKIFENEISPLYATDGSIFEFDEGVRADSTVEKLAKLKPVFDKFGDVTAGNSSQISDGAGMLILASEEAVKKYNLPVQAKIVDIYWAGLSPTVMGLGPVQAIVPMLLRNQLTFNDIDHVEINEAFAVQVLACLKAFNDRDYCKINLGLDTPFGELDPAKLNQHGGAVALGHPVGASGARLTLHGLTLLKHKGGKRVVASLCIGGGQGGAILLEKASQV